MAPPPHRPLRLPPPRGPRRSAGAAAARRYLPRPPARRPPAGRTQTIWRRHKARPPAAGTRARRAGSGNPTTCWRGAHAQRRWKGAAGDSGGCSPRRGQRRWRSRSRGEARRGLGPYPLSPLRPREAEASRGGGALSPARLTRLGLPRQLATCGAHRQVATAACGGEPGPRRGRPFPRLARPPSGPRGLGPRQGGGASPSRAAAGADGGALPPAAVAAPGPKLG